MNKRKGLIAGVIALAGLGASAQVQSANIPMSSLVKQEATIEKKQKPGKQRIAVNPLTGGLDMPPIFPTQFGMTPKEYGIRYGTGASKKKKSNRQRYATNAKISRRKAA
ncbi:unnamed protein product [Sphagnum balticum]